VAALRPTARGRNPGGNYYLVYDFKNGYNGCVDWSQPLFNRNLFVGCTGYDVLLLQRALVKEVGFNPADCIGIFGPKTFAFVRTLQKARGISSTGFVGPLTRASLNATYGQLA
jgi:peptidoglycan hydrolase-like protein with peptidoglycan-binding domain